MEYKKLSERISDPVNDNVKALERIFPSAVKDGEVDFEALKEELGNFKKAGKEKYELTWAGKQNAKKKAQEAVLGRTLKYVPEESKDADTTQNLYIEGDNLEVLKLLRENYYGSIKMIYIDPPYNTGNDFIYNDDFKMTQEESDIAEGDIDKEGSRLIKNQKSNNRYHAKWLSMMYPRLKLAKDLLSQDGVIFISIDDNEAADLRQMCDEIFDEENFVANLVWEKKKKGSFLSKAITNVKEYIMVYSKLKFDGLIGEINTNIETYPCINASNKREIRKIPKGIISKYKNKNYILPKGSSISVTTMNLLLHSDLVIKDGILAEDLTIEGNWRYSQDLMYKYAINKELYLTQDLYLRRIVSDVRYKSLKDILSRVGDKINDSNKEINVENLFDSGWGSNEDADEELRKLMGIQGLINYPKPTKLLFKIMASFRKFGFTVLDFFSGSATTAHAVMQLNAEDGGNRKFIMVQLPEPCDEKSEAYKAGYKNICEIGKERIRRAGDKIKKELEEKQPQNAGQQSMLHDEESVDPDSLDIGFKVFKTGDTNIKWTHEALKSGQIDMDESTMLEKDKLDFMPGFKDIDVVYEVLLRQRDVPLSAKIEKLSSIGDRTYIFAESFVVCLEEKIDKQMIEKLAAVEPLPIKFIFRDSAFEDDIELKDETFRRLSALIERNTGESGKAYTVEFI